MRADWSPEQLQLRESVARFLAERAPRAQARALWGDPRGNDPAVWSGLVELGLTGLLAPEELGGSGAGMCEMGAVLLELGRVVHPGPFLSSCVTALQAALDCEAQGLAAELAAGRAIGTLAWLDPDASFAAASAAGVRCNGARLSGRKRFVPDALAADFFLVATPEGIYCVEAAAAGVGVAPTETLDGSRRYAELTLSQAPATRLGDRRRIDCALDRWRLALAVDALGAAEVALELAVSHARERVQFGQPIGAFQAVAHLCADMLQILESGRAGVYYALWASDRGDERERRRSALVAKAYASEAFPRLASHAIQVFGGIGFTWEHDIQLYYKRILTQSQMGGTAEECLQEVSAFMLEEAGAVAR